jgi:uncharacterized repeat protein (TIGR03803 family)
MTKLRTYGWFTFESARSPNQGSVGRLRLSKLAGTVLVFCAAVVIASPAQTFNPLVSFNGVDGIGPDYGSLIQGADGNFYGTTSNGGANQAGTVFQVTPGGTLTTVYSFCSQAGCADGADPYAGLIQATDGNFYGTTYAGGAVNASCGSGCGTVYEISQTGGIWTESVLHTFCTQTNCPDGAGPSAGLVQGANGSFYGTTYAGGGGNCGSGCGTIFNITPQGTFATLQTFNHTQGAQLFAGLVQGTDGNFYGTTEGGGANNYGTVFVFNTLQGTVTTLYNFAGGTDGAHPYAGLIQAIDGNFYGTTYNGGTNQAGTAYEMSQQGGTWTETVLYSFCAQTNCTDGAQPYARLIQAADGNFYGTTSTGGINADGTVFKMIKTTAGASSLYVLYSFCAQPNCTDGQSPYAGLVQATNGNFYGTTTSGGANADGTLFVVSQANVTTWHNDNLRTGQNTNEIVLTPTNLSTSNFGQLCSVALDGQVYAQPLVLANVTFNGTQYSSLVYVVTLQNTLYVINGTPPAPGSPCTIVAYISLTPAGQYPADCKYLGSQNCTVIAPAVGALGTPVIQTAPNSIGTLYVVTETQDVPSGMPYNWYHYVHAVNLDQVAELTAPVRVFPPGALPCATCASVWSHHHIQRPGLLLVGNYLYIAFSMMDGNLPLPNGAVFKYNVANLSAPPSYFATTTENNAGGGIWQGGAGLAYGPDDSGTDYIYFKTGNGYWDGISNWGDSFIKLDPTSLTVPSQGYFTPSDQYYRNCSNPYSDLDFGSGGVMLTPATSNWPYLAVSGDKEGGIWAMDRLSPGGFNVGQCINDCQPCSPANQDNQNVQTVWLNNGTGPTILNTPAYWNNYVFIAPQTGPVSQYQVCSSGSGQPLCNSPVYATGANGIITTRYGATPSVSAGLLASAPPNSTNGILWLTSGLGQARGTHPGGLYGLDAISMAELYVNTGPGSQCSLVDNIGPVTKFSVPTVANGYVYLGTQSLQNDDEGTFYIFGLNRQCTGNVKTRPKSQRRMRSGLTKTGIATPTLAR